MEPVRWEWYKSKYISPICPLGNVSGSRACVCKPSHHMDENALIPSNLRSHKAVCDGLSIAVARIRAQERGENRYSLQRKTIRRM